MIKSDLTQSRHIIVLGAGVGGLTAAALLAQAGHRVTVLEAQTYPGGSAGTFVHKGYRFEAGATVVGGFQPDGPHAIAAHLLDLRWPVRPHEPAWVVHLPDRSVALTRDNADVERQFPHTRAFWREQARLADLCWKLSASGLPWPPADAAELVHLIQTGLKYFPADVQVVPFAFLTAHDWLRLRGLSRDRAFVRFIDAQLLIAAQTTSRHANGIYSATALDLARQGVYHVEGGIGGLSRTLADKVEALGGEVLYRHWVTRIQVDGGRVSGVFVRRGRRGQTEHFFPCDFLIANLTPWSLDELLGDDSPDGLRREVQTRAPGWGAFALHVGVRDDLLPAALPDHHQVIADMDGPLGEGRSVFVSLSPRWDDSRAPAGHRAVTLTTHTQVAGWWELLARDMEAYTARKHAYTERMLDVVERALPGFKNAATLVLPGTPVTYHYYTARHLGMVGGFPQTSLFKARGPRVGLSNLRLVGDSIFPGQSTAGVTLGAIRVVNDVLRVLPRRSARVSLAQVAKEGRP